jgi:type IV pilus assembly protein PilC
MVEWWFVVLLGMVATIFAFTEANKRSEAVALMTDKAMLKMPIIGDIVFNSIIARFARTLATTFSAGVPLVDALETVAGTAGNRVYAAAILDIRSEVTSGTQLNHAIRNAQIFPNMLLQMVAIGEESGALDDMLEKVAVYYEDAVDNMVDGLTAMLEPLIMGFLGVVIGGLMIAMYLPIFMMGSIV